jgi:hypothetical protein
MKRRHLLGAGALLASPLGTWAAASDWEQRLGYPSGWGPSRSWTDRTYRVGNYSGGYEAMFRARPIAPAASPAPLGVLPADGARAFEAVATRAQTYMRAWPVSALLIARKGTVLFEAYQFDRKPEMRMTSWSMAKSVTALLLGICIDVQRRRAGQRIPDSNHGTPAWMAGQARHDSLGAGGGVGRGARPARF